MLVSFSPTSLPLPYAIAATSALLQPEINLCLKPITTQGTAPQSMTLSINDAEPKQQQQKQRLSGESTILRYLARLGGQSTLSLYPEHTKPELTAQIDDWLLQVQRAYSNQLSPKDILDLMQAVNNARGPGTAAGRVSFLANAQSPTLADFAVWGVFQGLEALRTRSLDYTKYPHFVEWMERISAETVATAGRAKVNEMLDACKSSASASAAAVAKAGIQVKPDCDNPMDAFRELIASNVAKHCGVDEDKVLQAIECRPNGQYGHFCVPIPKLGLRGNPNQLAAELAQKVRL